MIPIVCIVGKSDSGKTTLIEKLIPELIRRGRRVGTIKHDVHGFDIDTEGKDSWRHARAGSSNVIISSPKKIAQITRVDHDHTLQELQKLIVGNLDIVLAEGYKSGNMPKIEVYLKDKHKGLLCTKEDDLVAVVGNGEVDCWVPHFATDDVAGIVDIIEEKFL